MPDSSTERQHVAPLAGRILGGLLSTAVVGLVAWLFLTESSPLARQRWQQILCAAIVFTLIYWVTVVFGRVNIGTTVRSLIVGILVGIATAVTLAGMFTAESEARSRTVFRDVLALLLPTGAVIGALIGFLVGAVRSRRPSK